MTNPLQGADALAADDPHRVLRVALTTPAPPAIAPAPRSEEVLLDWLLGLARGLDPAVAAGRIVAAVDPATVRNDGLLALLAEMARWPAPRLARLAPRGGRRARSGQGSPRRNQ